MKIKGQPGFVRDTNSGAVINNDTEAYSLYIKRRREQERKDKTIVELKTKVEQLEELLNEVIRKIKD